MRVLIACEFSGTVRDAFRNKGHLAVSCDILPSEKPGPHYQGNVLDILNDGWDMLIAHPPCTYITRAGACRLYKSGGIIKDKDRLEKGFKAKEFFMRLYNSNIEKICIENPLPLKVFDMPKHQQEIQPYQFGHPYSKRTLLWLKGLPILFSTAILANHTPYLPSNTSGLKSHKGKAHNKKDRQKTFEGIAAAMANQWG